MPLGRGVELVMKTGFDASAWESPANAWSTVVLAPSVEDGARSSTTADSESRADERVSYCCAVALVCPYLL